MTREMTKFIGLVLAATLALAFGATALIGPDEVIAGIAFAFRPLVLMCFLLAVLLAAMLGLPAWLKGSFIRSALIAALLLAASAPLLTFATMSAEPEYGYLIHLISLLGLGVFVIPVAALVMQFGVIAAGWTRHK